MFKIFLRDKNKNKKKTYKIRYTYLNCTDNYDVAKIKIKSVTDHQ